MFIAQYFASGWNILPNMSVFDVVNELNKQIVPTFCLLCEYTTKCMWASCVLMSRNAHSLTYCFAKDAHILPCFRLYSKGSPVPRAPST